MQEGEGGEKREAPTQHRLRDARKQGQVASSRDLTRVATSLVWLVLAMFLPAFYYRELAPLSETLLASLGEQSRTELIAHLWRSGRVLLLLTVAPLGVTAIVGILVVRWQVGPVFAPARIAARLAHLNPVTGFARLVSMANVVDVLKCTLQTLVIVALVAVIVMLDMRAIVAVSGASIFAWAETHRALLLALFGGTTGALLLISAGDYLFQRYYHRRNLRMSRQEVRREIHREQGDPQMRSQRRRLYNRWASGSARQATREATALVVNPTHIAVALHYDPLTAAVPSVIAMGEGELAALMRREAETAGVPVMRSVALARQLYFCCDEDPEVPERLFDAVAEVLVWAQQVRAAQTHGGDVCSYRESDSRFEQSVLTS
jgi:type III secretion protein U